MDTIRMSNVKELCVLAFMLCILGCAPGSSDRVKVATGILQGSLHDGILSFKGIPYASPPVGNLRWRPPQPVADWSGVRDATQYGHDCMQLPSPSEAAPLGRTSPSEDCLVLNVWAPAKSPNKKMAVMVWIHGGGFLNGGSSVPIYDGSAFAKDDIVFVTFNFRLGRFGFFAHPALTQENPAGPLGNYTYMDQIAALKWVKLNIAAFGGDPNKVTLMGESAGGGSVYTLMNSPAAKDLFSKGIVESGGGRDGSGPRHLHESEAGSDATPSGEALGVMFARSHGISGVSGDALEQLRNLPAEALVDNLNVANRRANPSIGETFAGPMMDGQIILEKGQTGYLAGNQMKIPMIVGANDSDLAYPQGDTIAALLKPFGKDAGKARLIYDPDGSNNVDEVGARIARDRGMLEPARYVVRLLAPQGQPVYEYRFSYVAESMRKEWQGAPHASEVPFVFDTVDERYGKSVTATDKAMARTIHGYWVNFAKVGNPNGEKSLSWPTYNAKKDVLANFTDKGAVMESDPLRVRLDLTEQSHHTQ
jgi:para-nitrobenzyl esterase